jgi:ferrous iron transport protein B
MEHSYLGHIGHFIAPAMQPVGLNWKTSIALISGMPAKEIVVSTIGVLYTNDKDANLSLAQRLDPKINHQSDFTPLMALSFMVFVLLYFPCLASITALVKESGSWKYGAFSIIYNTAVAWLASFLVYQIGSLFV